MNRSWKIAVVALVLAVGLLTPGCESRTEYVLGAVLPLSGSGASYARDIKQGIELGLEEINAAGGIDGLPLRVIFEDSGSDPSNALAAATRLMDEERVPAIIGGVLSSETLAIAPVAEEKEVVLLSPASSSPDITGAGNFIFRVYPSDVVEGTMMADFMLNVLGKSRIMILAVNNEYGRGLKTVFAKRYRSVPNREIIEVINFDQGQVDWSEEVAQIQEMGPDGIYLVGYPAEMLSFLEAMQEANAKYPILASRSFDVEMMKVPAAEGVIFPRDLFDPERTEVAGKFAEAYRSRYSEAPSIWAANGYDAVNLLADAMTDSGYRAEPIRVWLTQVRELPGASGIITFDRQGDVQKTPVISIVHNGEFITYNEYKEMVGK
ncbi:MAG: ABC transporter substrate-binding protein [Acidobacteriota bacterium]|jgi:branched-chain amino acid transport system substrate-binding protein